MSMYQIISVKTPPVYAKDAPRRELTPPALSFAQQARLDNAAVRERDRTGGKFHSDPITTLARRLEWLEALPDGQFNRITGRACWIAAEAAADNRIDALERAGLLKRVAFKPIQWTKVKA